MWDDAIDKKAPTTAPIQAHTTPDTIIMADGQPTSDDNALSDHSTTATQHDYEMLRAVLSARDNEIAILCTRLQQNNEALATAVEQLERTVSAAIDRFVRRLDRLEKKCGGSGVGTHNRGTVGGGGGYYESGNKRSRYNSR